MLCGAFQPVVAPALQCRELEHPQPVTHAFFQRPFGFVGLDYHFIEVRDVILHLLSDLRLCGAGETLALAFSLFVHVPDHTAPAFIGTLESVAGGQQFFLCHVLPHPFSTQTISPATRKVERN